MNASAHVIETGRHSDTRAATVHTGDRINVLFVLIQMAMGGAEKLVLNLLQHIDRRRFAPSLAWFFQPQALREFEALGIPLYYVPKQGRFDWKAMRQLGAIVHDQRIDVINAHHFMSAFYAFYASRVGQRAALVYTEHSQADVLNASGKWRHIGKHLIGRCDAAVGISAAVSATLSSHFDLKGDLVHTIENGVDVDYFKPAGADRDEIRARLGFAPDSVVIGHVANFRRNKNHLFLLRAFRETARRYPQARLIIVGEEYPGDRENSKPAVTEFIRAHQLSDRVTLLGYREDVQRILQALDVFCLVSHKEGLPLSLAEAMASGLPVIGTDIEGIRELIKPGVNGFRVRPDDVSELTTALDCLVGKGELRARLGTASRDLAVTRYSLSRCVAQTEDLFCSLVGVRSR